MIDALDFNFLWYLLIGILLTGYAILDGFDLGVGILHLFIKGDTGRRVFLNAIGPVWDGNEVWLVTAGGALFAAFPEVYATAFSGFYLPFMLLLFALIFRAVSIEFRSKQTGVRWRKVWDVSFFGGSLLASLLIGITLGNIIWGIPLDAAHNYTGTLLDLIHPYSLLVGITTVALFMMHGAIYLVLKTEQEVQKTVRNWVNNTMVFFIICYATTTMATLLYVPRMTAAFREYPWLFSVALLSMLAIANIPREIHLGREFRAFLSSSAAIAALMALFGIGMFPTMLYSVGLPENSLTIYNGASSEKTLMIMLIIALIGMPLVIAYTVSIYWIFRGKVKLDKMSY
ncbi:MAG: cytochrome d ubiquinol oxidase subunit II [bacterium]|nr:cytochrome d ubiquinol oxidase subunit II [bacterium]